MEIQYGNEKEGRTFNCSMISAVDVFFFRASVQHQSVLNISSFWCILLKLSFLFHNLLFDNLLEFV